MSENSTANKVFALLFRRNRVTRTLFFAAADTAAVFLSYWLALMLRLDYRLPAATEQAWLLVSLVSSAIIVPVFYAAGLYRFSWAFVSTQELIDLFKWLTPCFAAIAAVGYALQGTPYLAGFPRSAFLMAYAFALLMTSGVRLSKKISLNLIGSRRAAERERTLIAGAGDAGEQMLRNADWLRRYGYAPVGLVDDAEIKQRVSIRGLKVLGTISDIPRVAHEHRISRLIVAMPSQNKRDIQSAVEMGRQAGLRNIKIAPMPGDVIRGETFFKQLRDAEIGELLGRDRVPLDPSDVERFIRGRVILITGAAGSIGSELARQAARFSPRKLLLLDHEETGLFNVSLELSRRFPGLQFACFVADVRDAKTIDAIMQEHAPSLVLHAAAYKHVGLMEEHPGEAVKNNVFGTEVMAEAAVRNGVEKFVFISTDKAINPTSVMGATKRMGELICQWYNGQGATRFVSVRFGNVLDSRGSVIPIFREQIRRGGPVEVTHPEARRYFMLISEACLLVMQAGAMGQGGEVFVLDMGSPIYIAELARAMVRLSGFEPDRDIATVFIGLRPGEKLFEEILTSDEIARPTSHPRIFAAKLAQSDGGDIAEKKRQLLRLMETGTPGALATTLKRWFSEQ